MLIDYCFTMRNTPVICWIVALKVEAKPIIAYFKMSRIDHGLKFPIFEDQTKNNCLIITGVGQLNSSQATQLLRNENKAPPWAGFINIGIAGHGIASMGTLFLVDKIRQHNSTKYSYPSVVFPLKLPRSELLTSDYPTTDYKRDILFDMEGYGFFTTASRLSSKELIILLKIVSDGPEEDVKNLTGKKVSKLVSANIGSILDVSEKLRSISASEARRLSPPDICSDILSGWHFTVSQEHQLNALVKRWLTAFPNRTLDNEIKKFSDSKQILYFLKSSLDNNKVDWENLW